MDVHIASSLLAILLLAILGCVDAGGTVVYFNVSKTRVHKDDSIVFKCGATLKATDDGEEHTLIVNIEKWFPGFDGKDLTTNENIERGLDPARFDAHLHRNASSSISEIEFEILAAQLGDSGNYTCYTTDSNATVFVDVITEPKMLELHLAGELVGEMDVHDLQHGLAIKRGEEKIVQLEHSYQVDCVVTGGNPPPAVILSSGDGAPYDEVAVTRTTQREQNWMAEPHHKANASLSWTASVKNIGMELKCSSGVENPQAVWTSFVPVVVDRQPLFDCVDKVALAEGVNDLVVTCRVISMKTPLSDVDVRVYVGSEKNFTIDAQIGDGITETAYEHDDRYVVQVKPIGAYFWNVTVTIKNARQVDDLTSHKLEFVAVNVYDTTEHVVDVEAYIPDPDSSTSRMTISMAAVLFAMIFGAFCRP